MREALPPLFFLVGKTEITQDYTAYKLQKVAELEPLFSKYNPLRVPSLVCILTSFKSDLQGIFDQSPPGL